jgi:hypothetical protein
MTDRRYGVNLYGDSKLYGASDTRDVLAWGIEIDWDEDGVYDGNEASRLTDVQTNRGRKKLLEAVGQGFEKVPTGSAQVTLWNTDGRYDGWNTSSPLYPNVGYGKEIRILVRDLNGTADPYPLFTGVITDIIPVGYGSDAKVVIHASDNMDYLRNGVGRVAMQQNISPDAAIGYVLDAAGWRWGKSLDTATDTIRYWWASGNRQAITEIQELTDSFLGYFFINARGVARFVNRTTVGTSVVDYVQEELNKEVDNPQPYELGRNVVRLKVHPRTQAATGTIWQLVGSTPSILTGAANALTLFANYTYNNAAVPAINVITPVATTDWTVNSQSDGLGSNLTGSCTCEMTDFGDTAKLVFTNLSGSTGYLITPKIRGDAIYEVSASDITYPTDTSTVSRPRELVLDLPWQQDINSAVDIAAVMGAFYSTNHPMPNVRMQDYPSFQFTPELFDIVSLTLPYIGLTGESFRVSGIEHSTNNENCQSVTTRVYFEPYVSGGDYMQFDTHAEWDTSTIFGY